MSEQTQMKSLKPCVACYRNFLLVAIGVLIVLLYLTLCSALSYMLGPSICKQTGYCTFWVVFAIVVVGGLTIQFAMLVILNILQLLAIATFALVYCSIRKFASLFNSVDYENITNKQSV